MAENISGETSTINKDWQPTLDKDTQVIAYKTAREIQKMFTPGTQADFINQELRTMRQEPLSKMEAELVNKVPLFNKQNDALPRIIDKLNQFERKLLTEGIHKVTEDEIVQLFAITTNLIKFVIENEKRESDLKKRIDELHRMMMQQTILKDRMSLARATSR